jgi:hypothetical protein
LLLVDDHPRRVVSLGAHFRDRPVFRSAPRLFLDHLARIFESAAHGIPDKAIELIHVGGTRFSTSPNKPNITAYLIILRRH